MKLSAYRKQQEYSWILGLYPTIELIKSCPENIYRILVHSQLKSHEGCRYIQTAAAQYQIPLTEDDRLLQKISRKGNCFAAALFIKYKCKINRNGNHLVLVNPSDFGNLGTILRCMTAFGLHDLAIIQPAVDIFNPALIRASMGALFHLRFQYYENLQEYIRQNSSNNLYLFLTDGESDMISENLCQPFSLIFGNESSGLPLDYRKLGKNIRIRQSEAVDSLNLAISVGIVLHHAFSTG